MIAEGTPLYRLGSQTVAGAHACAFFKDKDEEYRVYLPFAQDCLNCGERCINFLDASHRQEHLRHLARVNVNAEAALASGQLELRTWDENYLLGGRFDQDDMLARIRDQVINGGGAFPRSRLWADADWSLSGLPGCDQLVEYESRVNTVLDQAGDILVCVYDLRKYSASMVLDILRTHPMVVVGEFLRPNPLYVPPEKFLPEYRQRRVAPRQ